MRISKSTLKQIIKEELDTMQKEGMLDMFKKKKPRTSYKPTRKDFTEEEWRMHTTTGELEDPADQQALETAHQHILDFLEDAENLGNVEKYKAMEELMRDLSRAMIWRPSKK